MTLVDNENAAVSKQGAKNGELVKISMRKMLVLKQAKFDFLTMQHVNTEILKENQNLRKELKELTTIIETWLNSSNKVNQCISEQIPNQKKRILGLDQLTDDPSSSGQTDLVFVKSSLDDTKMSIPVVERPWLSKARGLKLPNHDTGRIFPFESQVKVTNPSAVVTNSSATEYDSTDESLVCSILLPPLEKLIGAKPISGPKTIKSILKSNSIFKPETLKGVTINEPTSTPIKGNNNVLASKWNSAPTGKLKMTFPWLLKPIWYLDSGCSRHMTGVKSYLHKYVEQPRPKVVFGDDSACTTEEGIIFNSNKEVMMIALRVRDVYVLDMTSSAQQSCFFAKASESLNWLWHKKLAHLNFRTINELTKQNFVIRIPSLVYSKDKLCLSCEKGKHHRASFKTKQTSSIKKWHHLLYMNFFGPVTPRVENQNDIKVKQLRTNNGTEFRNSILVNFCDDKGISQNFSSPYTPEQNGVAEKKNKTLIEAARTMLFGSVFSKHCWTEAVATTCYTQNRSTIVKRHLKTPYENFFVGEFQTLTSFMSLDV
ncbi:retrovirus-related pol polyprotein from transposon TNT 1-94 [Tanacetum coccineum]